MTGIHPTACVDASARIGRQVTIGPFCVVEANVQIGDGCTLASHVCIKTDTTLGDGNEIGEGSVLGGRPQHLRAADAIGDLRIGSGNSIRENVTVHRGLSPGHSTIIGDRNMIMVASHIAHDCHVGSQVIIANNVMLAGHVEVADNAYLSGAVGIHQFCRVGRFAMVGGQAHISRDVPPFITVDGLSSLVVGLNTVGLRRGGFTQEDLLQLKQAYRLVFRSGLKWSETLEALQQVFTSGPATAFHEFLKTGKRGFVQERRVPRGATLRLPTRPADAEPPELRKVA